MQNLYKAFYGLAVLSLVVILIAALDPLIDLGMGGSEYRNSAFTALLAFLFMGRVLELLSGIQGALLEQSVPTG